MPILVSVPILSEVGTLATPLLSNFTEGEKIAIYFGDTQFRINMIFNFIISKEYIGKRF